MTFALYVLTAYCLAGGGPSGLTAHGGRTPRAEYTVASDWSVLPPGSVVLVLGHGARVVEDRGGGVRGHQLDMYVSDCDDAKRFGRQAAEVAVLTQVEARSERRLKLLDRVLADSSRVVEARAVTAGRGDVRETEPRSAPCAEGGAAAVNSSGPDVGIRATERLLDVPAALALREEAPL